MNANDVRGHLVSGHYPNYYDHYVQCTFRISALSHSYCGVRLYLRDFDIEYSPNCDKDYLFIDGKRMCGNESIGRESKSRLSLERRSPDPGLDSHISSFSLVCLPLVYIPFPDALPREIHLNFHTDNSGAGRGFSIEYLQQECHPGAAGRPTTPPRTDGNELEYKGPRYPPNYVYKAPLEQKIHLQVEVVEKPPERASHGSPPGTGGGLGDHTARIGKSITISSDSRPSSATPPPSHSSTSSLLNHPRHGPVVLGKGSATLMPPSQSAARGHSGAKGSHGQPPSHIVQQRHEAPPIKAR